MPDAYENFMSHEREFHISQSVSPMMTGEQENFFTCNYDSFKMNTPETMSPSSKDSSQMDACESLVNAQVFGKAGNTMVPNLEISMLKKTEIKILIQPVDKFRFRYRSEMIATHGSLLGEKEETSRKKQVPTVQLVNCPFKRAVIRCTLVTTEEDRRFPHAHHLIRKNGISDKDDPHDIEVSDANNFTAIFCNMGIVHTAKKYIKEEIVRKRKMEILEEKQRNNYGNATLSIKEDLQLKNEAEKAQSWMNLNSVALCFQGFFYADDNILHPFTEKKYSHPINNLKSALTGELKICRIDKNTGSCDGNEEVWLLVEKVGKKNIKVKFYEIDDRDNVIWDADGRFSELDVHHQYAIVFKTPPYKDVNITSSKEVLVKLERPSDGEVSNSLTFIYKPSNKILNRKRPRLNSTCENVESIQDNPVPNPSLKECLSMEKTYMNLDNDITSLSIDLKELLNDDNHCNSEEFKEYFSDLSTIESYLNLISSTSSSCTNSDLVTDGDDVNEFEPEEDFAKDVVQNVIKILKNTESTRSSKLSVFIKIRDLLTEKTNFGDTALHFSLRHEQYEISKCILAILSVHPILNKIINIQNSSGKTPLHLAILQNKPDIVKALLKLGADPNICDDENASSLHNAVTVNASSCVEEILKSGLKVNLEAYTESGWSALHLAAKIGSLGSVQALIAAGADVDSFDLSYGRTALHIAVDGNHQHIVDYLLTKTKIDVNAKNFGGNTALHSAVVKGGKCAEELVKILKKYGADPKIRNNNIDREDEEKNIDTEATRTITEVSSFETKESDTEDDLSISGESPFDLARNDSKLMQLLGDGNSGKPESKRESEDETSVQDRVFIQSRCSIAENRRDVEERTEAATRQQLSQKLNAGEEKLTDDHVNRIKHILDKTGGWERLARHTNHGSLARLYRKTSSPSSALFVKIRLQQPEITVHRVKKLLIDVQELEAASALETK